MRFFGRWDIILALGLIIISAATLFLINANSGKTIAVISIDGSQTERINLTAVKNRTIPINGAVPVVIETDNGRIRFLSAECPDKLCVRTGWISKAGQTAVCLPARVSITITGADDKLPDIITE